MPTTDLSLDPDGPCAAVENAAFVLALRERGVRETSVLRAMERVPREGFAPAAFRDLARRNLALPLACGATMTAPIVVATMLTALKLAPGARVLEIGTGSGYATALLVALGAASVTSLERYATLAASACARLGEAGPARVIQADGLAGLGAGRFDRILVNGTVPSLPLAWADALAPGGRLVAGLAGPGGSRLVSVERGEGGLAESLGAPFRLAALLPGLARVT
ncbi:protein-L-isoaspartate O-methyltransferase family protein [Methylobacterium soli]|uniref:Protein-L-isoaspartate O-methyltransferase n=1 Tax=Methylobacterium soli TaxID=553447 RepID=A0A6L3STX9_9HYPH|nr:protein-L-isoaspartate O-methyltransferase [Methylobacterium soli]KAB1077069.1 protein-L-isoaspartate O-methyltransferase [Methylobacterium soli]